MQADDPIEQLEGTSLDARFTLGALVARGGYGAVYRGTHRALGCPVAIKVLAVPDALRASERDRFVDAFQREAQIIAALRHPAIVRVIDFGVTPVEGLDHPLIVFEWIEGQTLDAWLRARARGLSPREALALLRPVLDAIAAVHEAGVAHRDLKPANVMVSASSRGAWEPKVLDFGVAKSFAPDEAPPTGPRAPPTRTRRFRSPTRRRSSWAACAPARGPTCTPSRSSSSRPCSAALPTAAARPWSSTPASATRAVLRPPATRSTWAPGRPCSAARSR